MKKTDPRTIQTKTLIKKTLLEKMQKSSFNKITVSELCKKAAINRGTFYLHYSDLQAVLEEVIAEALHEEPSDEPYCCSLVSEQYQCPYGICDKIHTHPEYGVVFFDDTLAEYVIRIIAGQSKDKYVASLTEQLSLTPEQAETLFYFQLNGCLAVNKMVYQNEGKDWEANRDLIGGFIQSGLKRYQK